MNPPERSAVDRLEGWKEIAAFLNRGVRTVQRWERTEALPVHRHMHDRQGSVYASRDELEQWWASRSNRLDVPDPLPPVAVTPARRPIPWRLVTAAAIAAIVFPVAAWRLRLEPEAEWTLRGTTPFTSAPGFEQQPSFSPDGRHVAYVAADRSKSNVDIYVQGVDHGEPQMLAGGPEYETNPVWSRDGRSIAYLRSVAGRPAEIVVQAPDFRGGARRVGELRFHGQNSPPIEWTFGGRWLIVSDKPAAEAAGLFRLNLLTAERVRLTTCDGACLSDASVTLSPDGSTMAFLRMQRSGSRDIWLLDVDGDGQGRGAPRQLTRLNAMLGPPTWTPDGKEIAFALLNDFTWVWQRVSTSGLRRSFDALAGVRPRVAFSPDGKYMVAPNFEENHDIRRVDLSTGEERDLVVSTRIDTNAQISPDGREIVFPSSRRGNIDLWKTSSDGSNAVQLFSVPGKSSGTPRWSPDGRQIAFDVADSQSSDIYVMDADGREARQLTDHPARDFIPAWAPDGQWIYFGSERDGEPQIYRIPVRGGAAVRVTKNGGFGSWASLDNKTLFVTKTMNKAFTAGKLPSVWRVRLSDGAEDPLRDVSTDWSRFVVVPNGIYFIASGPDDRHMVRFYDHSSGAIRDVHTLERPSSMGFSVSSDGKWLVYTSVVSQGSDLLLHRVHRR